MSDLISRQNAIKAIKDLPNCQNGFSDTYDKARIIGVIEEVPSAQRWIPCSERLPKDGRYLCTYANEEGICVDFGRFSKGEWFVKPIAWMPLPEPYKEENK